MCRWFDSAPGHQEFPTLPSNAKKTRISSGFAGFFYYLTVPKFAHGQQTYLTARTLRITQAHQKIQSFHCKTLVATLAKLTDRSSYSRPKGSAAIINNGGLYLPITSKRPKCWGSRSTRPSANAPCRMRRSHAKAQSRQGAFSLFAALFQA